MDFKMPGKVYKTAMSSLARSHMLIAAGTEDVQVRLCDIMSGAFAHTLSGHRGMLYHEIFGFFFFLTFFVKYLHGKRNQINEKHLTSEPYNVERETVNFVKFNIFPLFHFSSLP